MERKVLIRNISYMERELSEMRKELAQLDAQTEQQQGLETQEGMTVRQVYFQL
ncbi:hypothetical protein ACQKPX_18215 [Photobacterium sp. DNB23_23_1]|uniref:Uncharacterized protein n=1 Tax=Photobacterium pectinilyticum TaxID=2906793 RepID=A0ABT1NC84_9GAMM|nr:hypothetical protein [Photobacterium sp. ZSDE20]MCQ1061271.1 hypothetical protein [Photobacterium sp. ZSDE20]MDD1829751.1 hypothetical protein [Photobacterium sp. ZSDE20]